MVFLATQIRFSSLCQAQERFLVSTLWKCRCCLESPEPVRFSCGSYWLVHWDLAAGFPFTAGLFCGAGAKPDLWSSWKVLITKDYKALFHGKSEDLVELLFTGLLFVVSTATLLLEWICSGSLLTIQQLDDWLIGGCLLPRVHLTLGCLQKASRMPTCILVGKKDALRTLYSSLSSSLISL